MKIVAGEGKKSEILGPHPSGPHRGTPLPSARPPKISLFFSLWGVFPCFFLSGGLSVSFFSLSGGLLVEFWWCLKRRDTQICTFCRLKPWRLCKMSRTILQLICPRPQTPKVKNQ